MPRRYESAIWVRFERGAHAYDAATPGSRIGLAVARSIVQAHQGTIWYERSGILGGACFRIELELTH